MPWVHFEYISVASRNHTRDECTASAVGGASSGNGTANGTVTGCAVAQRNSVAELDHLTCFPGAMKQSRQHDVDSGLAVSVNPLLRFVGDHEVSRADDDVEIAAGVDVTAAAMDRQSRRPLGELG